MSENAKSVRGKGGVPWVEVYYCRLTKAKAPITEPVTKVGGAPVLMQPAAWPVCRRCEKPMQFLAQFRLDDPLPLAQRYQIAYIFMCTTCDDSWAPGSGVNAVLLQSTTAERLVQTREGQYPDYAVTLRHGKEPQVDRTDPDVDEEITDRIELKTKLGGAPGWIQYAEQPACPACQGPTRFVAELEAFGKWDGRRAQYSDLNFGDSGSSYLFLCEQECGPTGAAFLWQCM